MKGVLFCLIAGVLVNQRVKAAGCADGALGEVVPGTNCKQFTACVNGKVSSCPDGLIFVTSVGMCRLATQFTCDDGVNPGGNTGNIALCGNGQAFGAYVENCAAFVDCTTYGVKRCLSGLLFDIVKGVCLPASQATCYEGSGDEIPEYVKLECASLPLGSFVSHRNCEKYYICDGGVIEVASCPKGKHFSRAYGGCVNILQAQCRALGSVCVAQPVGYTFPSLQCANYYTCPANEVPVLKSCPANNVYNPNSGSCVPSNTFQCDDDIQIPGVSTNNPPGVPSTISSPGTGNPNAQCSTASSGTKVANPNDCTKYYMCNNGSAIPLNCYQGQYFSADNQLCSTTNPSSC